MRTLRLYWRRGVLADVDLGWAYLEDIPRLGDLLAHPTEHGKVWRVVDVFRHLIQEDSPTYRNWAAGRGCSLGGAEIFVHLADGPHFDGTGE